MEQYYHMCMRQWYVRMYIYVKGHMVYVYLGLNGVHTYLVRHGLLSQDNHAVANPPF